MLHVACSATFLHGKKNVFRILGLVCKNHGWVSCNDICIYALCIEKSNSRESWSTVVPMQMKRNDGNNLDITARGTFDRRKS